jgi:phospholipase C
MAVDSNTVASFKGIKRFVVLMLENRSFDHLLGYMKASNVRVAGLTGNESNQKDPNSPDSPSIKVSRASSFVMRFDPGHEFYDVQIQLYGPLAGTDPTLPPIANPRSQPAPMTGFIASATQAVDYSGDENMVMECFQSDQLPILTTLASEFALFNFWYSSLPGPTWPNRFFIHAATSGGLSDSPTTAQILEGFSFENETIYDRLDAAGKDWRIYNDGLPQTAGISGLRDEYVNPFTKKFQIIEEFFEDVKNNDLGDYNFIEPRYDTGNTLPDAAPDSAAATTIDPNLVFAADPRAPLSANQKTMAALALACDMKLTSPEYHAALISNHQKLVEQKDTADYIKSVEKKVISQRTNPPAQ